MAGVVLTVLLVASSTGCTSGSSQSASTQRAAPSATSAPAPSPSSADLARYPDGIPRTLRGEPVLRGAAILAEATSMTTADPFLVGTWLDVYTGPRSCGVDTRSLPPDSWLHFCQPSITPSDEAGSGTSVLQAADTVTFLFAKGLHSGPAILRVHVHDPRAVQCGPDESTCDRMIVVESAVWTGDAATDPHPISIDSARVAVERVVPGASLRPLADGDMRWGGPVDLRSGRTMQARSSSLGPGSDAVVVAVSVLPSLDAMGRALPKVTPGAAGALLPSAAAGSWGYSDPTHAWSFTQRWLVVANVAILINMLPTPSGADRALVGRLVVALAASG